MPRFNERGMINAVDALGRLDGADAQRAIMKQARNPSADVRRFVVSALHAIGTKEAQDRLAAMGRSDDSDFVRAKARKLLKRRSRR